MPRIRKFFVHTNNLSIMSFLALTVDVILEIQHYHDCAIVFLSMSDFSCKGSLSDFKSLHSMDNIFNNM